MDRFRVTPANNTSQYAQHQQPSLDYGKCLFLFSFLLHTCDQKVKRTSERERVASFAIMLGYACRVIQEKFCKR